MLLVSLLFISHANTFGFISCQFFFFICYSWTTFEDVLMFSLQPPWSSEPKIQIFPTWVPYVPKLTHIGIPSSFAYANGAHICVCYQGRLLNFIFALILIRCATAHSWILCVTLRDSFLQIIRLNKLLPADISFKKKSKLYPLSSNCFALLRLSNYDVYLK